MTITEIAPAKINLSLRVVGRRADGYHELESLVTFADCGDRVTVVPGSDCRVTATGPFARDIVGQNLLDKTVAVLRDIDPLLRFGAIGLEKVLPVAAGLGGGSADAAALLRAIRRANPERAEGVPWRQAALCAGADVPMCFDASPAFVWGIGERTAPLRSLPVLHAVLVNPRLPLATSLVFRTLGAPPVHTDRQPPALPPPLSGIDSVVAFMRANANQLEGAATSLLPVIAELKAALAALPGCRIAAMSGSGPTCFGIFASRPQALEGAAALADSRPGYWILAAELAGSRKTPSLNSPD